LPTTALLAVLLSLSSFSGHVEAQTRPIPAAYQFSIERGGLVMPDGVRLSVTYFKPKPRSAGERFPALLELLPYRKDDSFYIRDYPLYSYFAEHGFVAVKVDIRGTGSSYGKLPSREYSGEELADAEQIIAQLAAASWSNGNVGMWGISWGGFNALQVAMRRPPALKAILALHASDDLYKDDVHYIDGIFHMDPYMLSIDHENGLPRSPAYPLDAAYFRDRFESYPWLLTYMHQQRDGEFWRSHSVRWQEEKIDIPVYLIGGLLDGYRDTVPRLLEKLHGPARGVVGPWEHDWPDNGTPGPNYEWRQDAVLWFNRWLRDGTDDVTKPHRFSVFVRSGHAPGEDAQTTPGQWLHNDWPLVSKPPVTSASKVTYFPSAERKLASVAGQPATHRQKLDPGKGFELGEWWGDVTGDMRNADAASFTYDSDPLSASTVIIGFPNVRLRTAVDAELAHWVVRLEDVQPDGTISFVTGAALNGSQRDSRTQPSALRPGEPVSLEFDLHFTTWTFQPGHRIRLAVSNGIFPMLWPPPQPVTTELFVGNPETSLTLPVVTLSPDTKQPGDEPRWLSPEPRKDSTDARWIDPPKSAAPERNQVTRTKDGITTVEWSQRSDFQLPHAIVHTTEKETYQTNNFDPAHSSFLGEAETQLTLKEGRKLRLLTTVVIRSDRTLFHVTFTRRLFNGTTLVREKTWKEEIPRDFQ
jgi:predicted acyl esterase